MTTTAPLAYSLRTAAEATGFSKTHLIDAINAGRLKAKRSTQDPDGNPTGKYVIFAAELEAYLASLPDG